MLEIDAHSLAGNTKPYEQQVATTRQDIVVAYPRLILVYLSFLGVSGLVVDNEFELKLRWSV
jgi:hypothetical protein